MTGEGRTRAWAAPARGLLGCRHCGDGGGRLTGADFAAAVGVLADRWQPAPHPRPVWTRAPAPPSDLADVAALVASVWRRADPLADSPGAAYLQQRIGWAAPWPSALRWLPADAFADVRPWPPDGAAGLMAEPDDERRRAEAREILDEQRALARIIQEGSDYGRKKSLRVV